MKHLWRLYKTIRILGKHDALFLLDSVSLPFVARFFVRKNKIRRPGERLAAALQELGPTFIKLGQTLATRSDLVGEKVAADLSLLQDRLPPFSGKIARAQIDMSQFQSFDENAVAAASIAQVHKAVTAEGRDVAVKILRPNIERDVAQDLDFFEWIAMTLTKFRPSLQRLRLSEVVAELRKTVALELDLRLEASAAEELRQNFVGDPDFYVPQIDWQRTSQRVLVLEWVSGIRVNEKAELIRAGYNPRDILQKAARTFFLQVFRDGFFHADMHPGNLFIGDGGKIIALDFGIMGRIDLRTRNFLADMLVGFLTRDYKKVAQVHFDMGFVPDDKSVELFAQACRAIGEPILGKPLQDISLAQLLGQLFKVTEDFDMPIQPQLLLLQKTMLMAEGMGRMLDDSVNMWQLAQPMIEDWMRKNRGFKARAEQAMRNIYATLERLPVLLDKWEASLDRINVIVEKPKPQWPIVLAWFMAGLILGVFSVVFPA